MKPTITVETFINAPIEKIWSCWTKPEHITKWAFASDDWCAPHATNDLTVGGTFLTRMESTDGKTGFDFGGTYTSIEQNSKIEYVIGDGRGVSIEFIPEKDGFIVSETFEIEDQNPAEMQKSGWQAILENFKKYVEAN